MDRRTIIAFILITIVLVFTPWYINLVAPTPPLEPDTTTTKRQLEPPLLNQKPETIPVPADETTFETISQHDSIQETIISVSNPLFTAKLSNRFGGSFKSFILNKYSKYDSTNVDLINENNIENLLIGFISIDGEPTTLGGAWSVQGPTTSIDVQEKPSTISFSTVYQGRKVTKSFTFYPNNYQVDINVDIASLEPVISQNKYSLSWRGGLSSTEKNEKDDFNYFKGSASLGGEILSSKSQKWRPRR